MRRRRRDGALGLSTRARKRHHADTQRGERVRGRPPCVADDEMCERSSCEGQVVLAVGGQTLASADTRFCSLSAPPRPQGQGPGRQGIFYTLTWVDMVYGRARCGLDYMMVMLS